MWAARAACILRTVPTQVREPVHAPSANACSIAALREIATYLDMSFLALLTAIDSTQNQGNLSSAIRLFVLNFYREKLEIHDKPPLLRSLSS
jgi:hypothetical protein